jgi:8-oxo-dGTP pyrophosphatase MutT (NUDIX family)
LLSEQNIRARLGALQPNARPAASATPFAAVAAVLRYGGSERGKPEPDVLLIRRSQHPGDPWSGHMAFPGGRRDPGDADLVRTAVRETLEEVGLNLDERAEWLGRLDDVQAISRAKPLDLVIVPHVFIMRSDPAHRDAALVIDETEVDEALWTPLGPMARGETSTIRPYEHRGRRIDLPGFQVGEHVVWGLTHRMLAMLFEALKD